MTDAPVSPQWIDVSQADDLRDVIHRAVACLAQGGVVGLATETVYGVAASALHSESVSAVRRIGGADPSRPMALLLKGPAEVSDWVPDISLVGRRMSARLWPGPVTLVFSNCLGKGLCSRLPATVKSFVAPRGDVALRCPVGLFVRDVLKLLPAPLVISTGPTAEQSIPVTADALRGITGLDMVIDAGPTQYQRLSTIVRIDDDRWTIEREGAVATATISQSSSVIILFVCTGNTCRSPMAEALCKLILAQPAGMLARRALQLRIRRPLGRNRHQFGSARGRTRHRRRAHLGRLAREPPQPQDRRQPGAPGRLYLRHDRRPSGSAASARSPTPSPVPFCSTHPATMSPTRSAAISTRIAERPR